MLLLIDNVVKTAEISRKFSYGLVGANFSKNLLKIC